MARGQWFFDARQNDYIFKYHAGQEPTSEFEIRNGETSKAYNARYAQVQAAYQERRTKNREDALQRRDHFQQGGKANSHGTAHKGAKRTSSAGANTQQGRRSDNQSRLQGNRDRDFESRRQEGERQRAQSARRNESNERREHEPRQRERKKPEQRQEEPAAPAAEAAEVPEDNSDEELNEAAAAAEAAETFLTPPATPAKSVPASTSTATPSTSGSAAPVSGAVDTGGMNRPAGSSMPGGPGGDIAQVIITENDSAPRGKLHFRHCWQVQAPSLQFKAGQDMAEEEWIKGMKAVTTPLVTLDPSNLHIYMTKAEYTDLPAHSWATKCRIKVTPLGYRAPFSTNDTTSSMANSQTVVQIAHAIGLNKIMNGFVSHISVDSASPTSISSTDFTKNLPGASELYESTANFGECVWWNSFWSAIYKSSGGMPNLLKYVEIQNVQDTKGIPIINYEYNFKSGRLKYSADSSMTDAFRSMIPEGTSTTVWGARNATSNGKKQAKATDFKNQTVLFGEYEKYDDTRANYFTYDTAIEKSFWTVNNYGNNMTPDAPPLIHFGTMPTNTSTTLGVQAYAPVITLFQIETYLEVEYNMNYFVPLKQVDILQSCDPSFWSLAGNNKNMTLHTKPFYSISGRRINIPFIKAAGNDRGAITIRKGPNGDWTNTEGIFMPGRDELPASRQGVAQLPRSDSFECIDEEEIDTE